MGLETCGGQCDVDAAVGDISIMFSVHIHDASVVFLCNFSSCVYICVLWLSSGL